jgi:hypothetical protein
MHLKNDPRTVDDSEVDLVTGSRNNQRHPIEPERLRVFPDDSDIPGDELNTTIDRHFVPIARVDPPPKGKYDAWNAAILAELRRATFRSFPERIPPARLLEQVRPDDARLESEPGIGVRLQHAAVFKPTKDAKRVLMVVRNPDSIGGVSDWVHRVHEPGDHVYVCAPRGVDQTSWTRKDPPNYVERSHVLLGRTVDTGRVWDIIAAARYLHGKYSEDIPVYVLGKRAAGVLTAYAALLEPDIAGVILNEPPLSHMDAGAPQFLNVLRVCDVPDVLGMLAPRALTVYGKRADLLDKVSEIYGAAEASAKFVTEQSGRAE